MTPREELLAAADLIRERGWCKGDSHDKFGRLCMAGAYALVTTGDPDGELTDCRTRRLEDVIGPIFISSFNDYHCQTKYDAIAALEIAADLAA